jgi:hypothetical protein
MKHFFTTVRLSTRRPVRAWLGSLLVMFVLAGQPQQAQAQFPRTESFQNSTAGGFTLGGVPNAATLTAATGGPDANGSGYLRLTSAAIDQSGYAIDQSSFLAPNGFSISFEFFSYGGTGADGFSMFLVDADKVSAASFTAGAPGGALGYAQRTRVPTSNGVPFGYIGIGIDEYGNYSNPIQGQVGGPGFTSNVVAIRGSGNGQGPTDYPYLVGSPKLPFDLSVSTVRALAGSADYRRAYIDVLPVTDAIGVKTYRITVRIQHGLTVQTAISNLRARPAARPTSTKSAAWRFVRPPFCSTTWPVRPTTSPFPSISSPTTSFPMLTTSPVAWTWTPTREVHRTIPLLYPAKAPLKSMPADWSLLRPAARSRA